MPLPKHAHIHTHNYTQCKLTIICAHTHTYAHACTHRSYIATYCMYTSNSSMYLHVIIAVAQLSINGTTVDSVTDRDNEPQYHVKEDAGSITLCIRVESFPEEKDNLTINYYTLERTACKYFYT